MVSDSSVDRREKSQSNRDNAITVICYVNDLFRETLSYKTFFLAISRLIMMIKSLEASVNEPTAFRCR